MAPTAAVYEGGYTYIPILSKSQREKQVFRLKVDALKRRETETGKEHMNGGNEPISRKSKTG